MLAQGMRDCVLRGADILMMELPWFGVARYWDDEERCECDSAWFGGLVKGR